MADRCSPTSSQFHAEEAFSTGPEIRANNPPQTGSSSLSPLESPSHNTTAGTKGAIDGAVDEYMLMAARMLYDIIRDRQKRQTAQKAENKLDRSENREGREL